MIVAKKKPAEIPGSPLTENFHPKDSPTGVIARLDSGHGCSPDMRRGTIHVGAGGARLEMTPEAAQQFVDGIQCAIDCVKARTSDRASKP
jgi:hypothetical protein